MKSKASISKANLWAVMAVSIVVSGCSAVGGGGPSVKEFYSWVKAYSGKKAAIKCNNRIGGFGDDVKYFTIKEKELRSVVGGNPNTTHLDDDIDKTISFRSGSRRSWRKNCVEALGFYRSRVR